MAVKNNLHGVILLDKPSGLSSNQALQKVKRLVGAKKAGHTGSLDPLATGLLPICLGQATKVSEYLLGSDKRYETVIKLGKTTTTLDAEGEILLQRPVEFSEPALEAALENFRGEIQQIPPMYSALKKNGQPLYKLARKGQEVERQPRTMQVYELTAERLDQFHLRLNVHCSSGFYIRSLAADLGEALQCGAHVVQLRRTQIKTLKVSDAVSLAQLERDNARDNFIKPIDSLLQEYPSYILSNEQLNHLKHGRNPRVANLSNPALTRFYTEQGELFGLGNVTEQGVLKAQKQFVTAD